jgi:hypothetical protein
MTFGSLPKPLQYVAGSILLLVLVGVFLLVVIVVLPVLTVRHSVRWLQMPKWERIRRREAIKAARLAFNASKNEKACEGKVVECHDDHCIVSVRYVNEYHLSSYAQFCYRFEQKNCEEINYYRDGGPTQEASNE